MMGEARRVCFHALFLVAIFLAPLERSHCMVAAAWQPQQSPKPVASSSVSRRQLFEQGSLAVVTGASLGSLLLPTAAEAAQPNGLKLNASPSGLKWADAKIGTGQPLRSGMPASIDYSMASTAGRFPQIYSTKDTGSPYRWTLGDGSTIAGIELAILGDENEGIPPMVPGSIRRVVIPETLGFLALKNRGGKCSPEDGAAVGPIPPKENIAGSGAYQRWYQFYCNPRIPYQPDLVMDIKLYGKR